MGVSLVISTLVFLAALYYLRRWADQNDIPKGMTRNVSIFTAAIALSYGAAWIVDKVA
jgi:hypothetical protein